ncbi:MAG: hypothetical protein AAGJ35_03180 [Myxococcota bacterium]
MKPNMLFWFSLLLLSGCASKSPAEQALQRYQQALYHTPIQTLWRKWFSPKSRQALLQMLQQKGISLSEQQLLRTLKRIPAPRLVRDWKKKPQILSNKATFPMRTPLGQPHKLVLVRTAQGWKVELNRKDWFWQHSPHKNQPHQNTTPTTRYTAQNIQRTTPNIQRTTPNTKRRIQGMQRTTPTTTQRGKSTSKASSKVFTGK